jgi:ATP phosphoribosyltransferase regulatory subunit HisZ
LIKEYEIPNGSKLYFGDSAKRKRKIEYEASEFLIKNGFSEIVTPHFFTSNNIQNENTIIHTQVENNQFLSLRPDSTIEVLRLVLNRLDNNIQKWFYIQPIFLYPSNEYYQIGIEYINFKDMAYILDIFTSLLSKDNIEYTLQISNINIVNLLIKNYNINKELLSPINLQELLTLDIKWLNDLAHIHTINDLDDIQKFPEDIQKELINIKNSIKDIKHKNIIIEPLYYDEMKYYESIYFRAFSENTLIAKGGIYQDSGVVSSGFAIYTDQLIDKMIRK